MLSEMFGRRPGRPGVKAALAVAGIAALVSMPAAATDLSAVKARYTPAFSACLANEENQTTLGMIECMNAEMEVQDAALNSAYRTLIADLTPEQKAGLKMAQRAWIAFRNADCSARYSPDWGTFSSLTSNMCMVQRTVERTLELEAFVPDLSAPADSEDPPGTVGVVP
jgi:uncharacterized protein YecT (DUF1311 family)